MSEQWWSSQTLSGLWVLAREHVFQHDGTVLTFLPFYFLYTRLVGGSFALVHLVDFWINFCFHVCIKSVFCLWSGVLEFNSQKPFSSPSFVSACSLFSAVKMEPISRSFSFFPVIGSSFPPSMCSLYFSWVWIRQLMVHGNGGSTVMPIDGLCLLLQYVKVKVHICKDERKSFFHPSHLFTVLYGTVRAQWLICLFNIITKQRAVGEDLME